MVIVETFDGPCSTRIEIYSGETIRGFFICQTSVNEQPRTMSPCIRSLTAKDHPTAQRILNRWKNGKN